MSDDEEAAPWVPVPEDDPEWRKGLRAVDQREEGIIIEAIRRKRMAAAAALLALDLRPQRALRDDYEFLPSAQPYFQWILSTPVHYRNLCRLTTAETLDVLKRLGFDAPHSSHGRWKYSALHRFVAYLHVIADYTRFEKLIASQGWSPASIEANIDYWTTLILDRFEGTRTHTHTHGHSLTHPFCVVCMRHPDRIQRDWPQRVDSR
jgi:hypothetical protein